MIFNSGSFAIGYGDSKFLKEAEIVYVDLEGCSRARTVNQKEVRRIKRLILSR